MKHSQSNIDSWIEAVSNTVVGFFVSFALWYPMTLMLHVPYKWQDNVVATSMFTVASVARSYILRRVFDTLRIAGYGRS